MNLSEKVIKDITKQLKEVGIEIVSIEDYPPYKENGHFLTLHQIQELPEEQKELILEKRRLRRQELNNASREELNKILGVERQECRKWVEEENERRYQEGVKKGTALSPKKIEEYIEIIVNNLKDAEFNNDDIDYRINVNVHNDPIKFDKATRYKEIGIEDGGFDGRRYIPHTVLGDITSGSRKEIMYQRTNYTYEGDSAVYIEGECADFNMAEKQIVLIEEDISSDSTVLDYEEPNLNYILNNIEIYEPNLELAQKYNRYKDYYVHIRRQEFAKKIMDSLGGKTLTKEQLNYILDGYDFTEDFDYPEVTTTSEPREFDDLTCVGINGVSYPNGFEGIKKYSKSVLGDTKFATKNEHTYYETNNPEADIDNSSIDADFSIKKVQVAEVEEYKEYTDRNYESTESKRSIIIYIPDERVKGPVESYKELIARDKKESELKELMELEDKIDDLTKQVEQKLHKDKKELQTL